MLKTEDFAIVIKKLPKKDEYNSVRELKALLWNHLENIVN